MYGTDLFVTVNLSTTYELEALADPNEDFIDFFVNGVSKSKVLTPIDYPSSGGENKLIYVWSESFGTSGGTQIIGEYRAQQWP